MISTLLNNRYYLEEELGRGGMGVVYSGKDTLLYRDVAVKVLMSPGMGAETKERLLREARAAAGLNHPGIVSVYDVGVLDDITHEPAIGFIVMERIHGETLADRMPLSSEEILDVLEQVCAALQHAHENDVIHRDLKPDNIAITPEGKVKIMDFGLAKTTADRSLEESRGISGSLPYIAPEVVMGEEAGPQADLYALGVILYELYTGRLPFEGDDLAAMLTQLLHSPITPPSTYNNQIPPLVDALITRLLQKQPHKRPASASDVRSQLSLIRQPHMEPSGDVVVGAGILNRLVRGRLIGRKEELSNFVTLWRSTVEGHGTFALVSGEPGIGKSRLIREVSSYVNLSGGIALSGECFAHGGIPYMPFTEIISSALKSIPIRSLPREVLADLLTMAPEVHLELDRTQGDLVSSNSPDQQRLFESVVILMVALSRIKPVLIFIDDLHWADSGTLALVQHLSRRLRHRSLMIIGAYREVELSDERPLKGFLNQFFQERLVQRFKLTRMDYEETKELLSTLFSSEVSKSFSRRIFEETEGNPFFIEEVCKTLIDSGQVSFTEGSWQLTLQGGMEIPQGIRRAIQSRLAKLSDLERELLQGAALLGREFDFGMLKTISKLPEEQLIEILENGIEYQLIEEMRYRRHPDQYSGSASGQPTFIFTHSLIHATLVDALGSLQRQRYQLKVARALDNSYPEKRAKLAPLLGRYYAEAGVVDKAIEFLLLSGDSARNLFAYDEAIKAYKSALLFLEEENDNNLAARTYMKLGLVYHSNFQFEQARQAYEQGFIHWQKAPIIKRVRPLPPTQILKVHLLELPTIDPSRSLHFSGTKIIQQLFAGLVELRSEHEIVPDLASRWEVLDEGRRYRFYLKDDLFWSDGQRLTAHDFVFSWKRALEPGSGTFPAELFYDIRGAESWHRYGDESELGEGLTAINDGTLQIELEGPTSYFLHLLSQSVASPLPRHIVDKWNDAWTSPQNIVSNGPFILESWRDAESLTLTRNPYYHGEFRGNVERVIVRFLNDPAEAQSMYEEGKLDLLELFPLFSPEGLNDVRRRNPDDYYSGPTPSVFFIAFNLTKQPLLDSRVRRALALATDRDRLVDIVLQGLFRPATGGFVPRDIPGHTPGLGLGYNPAQARRLFEESGYGQDKTIHPIKFSVSGGATYHSIAVALADMWRDHLQVEVNIQPIRTGDDRQLTLASVVPEYPDPDCYLRINSWGPVTGWRNDDFNQLIEEARRNPDWEQRMLMYQQADWLLIEDISLLPLAYGRFHSLIKPWIKEYPLSALSVPRWKDVVIEKSSD